jgi:hypothetical protein
MGILLDKQPDYTAPVVKEEKQKPFLLYLEKYKGMVTVTSLKVSDTDEAVLEIEFDHSIDAPQEDIQTEVGRLIIERLEDGIASLEKSNLVVENVEDTKE